MPPSYWIILGFILIIAEFIIPGFIIFFFGIGAIATGILSICLPLPVYLQYIIFGVLSTVCVLAFRRFMPKTFSGVVEQEQDLPLEALEYAGQSAKVIEAIRPGVEGKVEFQDSDWRAKSSESLQVGEIVTIVRRENLVLVVSTPKGE
jgi:membrane protein implicated in regulation of membrane protease activity